jgi:hypothetical protein
MLDGVALWFHEGGWPMYPIFLLAFGGLPLALLHAFLAHRVTALLTGVALFLALTLGAGGMLLGRAKTDEALAMVNAKDADMIRTQGYAESAVCLQFGGGVAAAMVPFFLVGTVRMLRRKAPAAKPG